MEEKDKETVIDSLMTKGRLTVFIMLFSTTVLCAIGAVTSDQYVEIFKMVGLVWLGAEAATRSR